MKRLAVASVLISVGAFVACAVEPTSTNNTGGAAAIGGTGPVAGMGQGGSAGSATGGSSGSGVGATGGTDPVGGAAGVGATGGSSGAGPAGSGGAGAVGGMSGGTGGMPPMGGMAGEMGGMAGAAGDGMAGMAGGGGMPPMCPTPATLFPEVVPTGQGSGLTGNPNPPNAPASSLDGYLIQTPCSDTSCDDCTGAGWVFKGITTGCSGGLNAVQNFTVGGTPGEPYRVTMHFYGIAEPKDYGNQVTREASGRPQNLDSGAANPTPWAYATGNPTYRASDYNTYEIHVVDHMGQEVCSYFLNADTQEGHWTYVINYSKTINVIGGGRVRVRVYDRNCRMIKNCYAGGSQGPCNASGCNNKARTVSTTGADPAPMGLNQPGLGNDTNQAGQWLLIDVTQVQCDMPALGCNGQ